MSIFNQFINSAARQVGRNVANDVYYRKGTVKKAGLKEWIIALALFFGVIGGLFYLGKSNKASGNEKLGKVESSTKTSIQVPEPATYNGHTIYTGKRGGKYYYNNKGRKVYIH